MKLEDGHSVLDSVGDITSAWITEVQKFYLQQSVRVRECRTTSIVTTQGKPRQDKAIQKTTQHDNAR